MAALEGGTGGGAVSADAVRAGRAYVEMGLNDEGFAGGLERAKGRLKAFSTEAHHALHGLGGETSGLGQVFGRGGVVSGLAGAGGLLAEFGPGGAVAVGVTLLANRIAELREEYHKLFAEASTREAERFREIGKAALEGFGEKGKEIAKATDRDLLEREVRFKREAENLRRQRQNLDPHLEELQEKLAGARRLRGGEGKGFEGKGNELTRNLTKEISGVEEAIDKIAQAEQKARESAREAREEVEKRQREGDEKAAEADKKATDERVARLRELVKAEELAAETALMDADAAKLQAERKKAVTKEEKELVDQLGHEMDFNRQRQNLRALRDAGQGILNRLFNQEEPAPSGQAKGVTQLGRVGLQQLIGPDTLGATLRQIAEGLGPLKAAAAAGGAAGAFGVVITANKDKTEFSVQ